MCYMHICTTYIYKSHFVQAYPVDVFASEEFKLQVNVGQTAGGTTYNISSVANIIVTGNRSVESKRDF